MQVSRSTRIVAPGGTTYKPLILLSNAASENRMLGCEVLVAWE